jgi:hypothetical protein
MGHAVWAEGKGGRFVGTRQTNAISMLYLQASLSLAEAPDGFYERRHLCYKSVTRVLQVTRVLDGFCERRHLPQECYKSVTRVLQAC